jgi:hypothetical protein
MHREGHERVTALLTENGYALQMILLCVVVALVGYLIIDINNQPPK